MKELFHKRPRNPLSIIGLFISLVYGCACLVFSQGMNFLYTSSERLPLIWFVVLFPLIILIVFTYLVIKHRFKLYGPSDFQNENNFFRDTSENELNNNLLTDNDELGNQKVFNQYSKINNLLLAPVSKSNKNIQALLQMENYALNKIESIKGVVVKRFQTLEIMNLGLKIQLDGMYKLNNEYHTVEVKIIFNEKINSNQRLALVRKIELLQKAQEHFKGLSKKLKPIFIFIIKQENEERIKEEISLIFLNYKLNHIECYFFKENELNQNS